MARFGDLIPSAGRYLNGADKAMLAADPDAEKADERVEDMAGPVAMRLVRAVYQPRARFGPRFLIDARVLATGEMIAVDFAAADKEGTPIEARVQTFNELRDRLDAGEAFDPVILARIAPDGGGNPFWTFVDAPAGLIDNPVEPIWYDDADDDEQPEPEPVRVRGPRLAKAQVAPKPAAKARAGAR